MATKPRSLTKIWEHVIPPVDLPFAVTKKVSVKNWESIISYLNMRSFVVNCQDKSLSAPWWLRCVVWFKAILAASSGLMFQIFDTRNSGVTELGLEAWAAASISSFKSSRCATVGRNKGILHCHVQLYFQLMQQIKKLRLSHWGHVQRDLQSLMLKMRQPLLDPQCHHNLPKGTNQWYYVSFDVFVPSYFLPNPASILH